MRLADVTTLRLGGEAGAVVEVTDDEELVATLARLDDARRPLLLLGGGSNIVISDDGFPGTCVLVRSEGIDVRGGRLTVAAGTPWDQVVDFAVGQGLAGIECLSGIPGRTGATPIQNVGAYGQDVSQTVELVRAYDRHDRLIVELGRDECGFAYRSSLFKRQPGRYAVLSVTFALEESPDSRPVAYAELAKALGVEAGATAALKSVRDAVLELRRGKGMVIDEADPDTRSVGSFFTNPIVPAAEAEALADRAGTRPPQWPEPDGRVKLSAAWLVGQAGFERGYGRGGARVSTKHTLALTSQPGGTTVELIALAREIRSGVMAQTGVSLTPEPVLIGVSI